MQSGITLTTGRRHRSPLDIEGAAAYASKVTALSQTPRFSKTVFLNEITCMVGTRRSPGQLFTDVSIAWSGSGGHPRAGADGASSTRSPARMHTPSAEARAPAGAARRSAVPPAGPPH